MEEGDWSALPLGQRLQWSGHPSFALTCSQWRSAVSPFYPAWITPLLLSTSRVGVTNLRYYSPYYHKNFEVASDGCDTARGAKICCATGQHLARALALPTVLLDADLVTGTVLRRGCLGSTRLARSGLATPAKNNDGGEWDEWTNTKIDHNGPRLTLSPVTNPVIRGGLIYLLGEQGRLAVYNPYKHEEGFEILDKPVSFGFEYHDSYLVESDQDELMVVLVGRRGTPVYVIKLNEQTMEWEKVEGFCKDGRCLPAHSLR
uniref:KIB1-4 beta-propeller domain-containing protein n=1 Tax=Leersia perrieri TaxID=77586 RepID=A0A0D9XDD8_9ORYZ